MKWFAVICLCLSCSVFAHSLSTAFMQLQNTEAGLSATLELSIVDLQQALNWPADQDIRWSDIKKIRHKSSAICSNICIYKTSNKATVYWRQMRKHGLQWKKARPII